MPMVMIWDFLQGASSRTWGAWTGTQKVKAIKGSKHASKS